MANKTIEISAERKMAQESLAHQEILSWHGQRVRVVGLGDEECFIKIVGQQGGNTGARQKVRYGELKEWSDMERPQGSAWVSGSDFKPLHDGLKQRDRDEVPPEQEGIMTTGALEKSEKYDGPDPQDLFPDPTKLVEVVDMEVSIVRHFPQGLVTQGMRTVTGWVLLDYPNRRVWLGTPPKWSKTEVWDGYKVYSSEGFCDRAYRSLIEDGDTVVKLTHCQFLMYIVQPKILETWLEKAQAVHQIERKIEVRRHGMEPITTDAIAYMKRKLSAMEAIQQCQLEIESTRREIEARKNSIKGLEEQIAEFSKDL